MRKLKKPKFLRQMSVAYKRVGKKWRRPRGWHSKLRIRQKSKGKMPSIGYRSPKSLRFLHPSLKREVVIQNIQQLSKINPEKEAVKIAHVVGKRKRKEMLKKAEELKIKVLNP